MGNEERGFIFSMVSYRLKRLSQVENRLLLLEYKLCGFSGGMLILFSPRTCKQPDLRHATTHGALTIRF